MHRQARAFIAASLASFGQQDGLTVEIGARNINGSIRDLFVGPYLAIDVQDGPGVDRVVDATALVLEEPAACVVCCEVLEHADNAADICAAAHRLLAPGGLCLLTAASPERVPHSAIDGGALREGEFYRGVSVAQLRAWLAPFAGVEVQHDPRAGDVYAVAFA